MPFWKGLKKRASDVARRARTRVTRSAASSLAGVGNRLSNVGNELLETLPPEPSMGARSRGPVRDLSRLADDQKSTSSSSSNSLHRDNPRSDAPAGLRSSPIVTNPNTAWGSSPDRRNEVPPLIPPKNRAPGSALSSTDDGKRLGRRPPRRLDFSARSQASAGTAAHELSAFMSSTRLSQYQSPVSTAGWYQSSGASQYHSCASQATQGIDWRREEESSSSSSEGGEDYENVQSGLPCHGCGARLIVTYLTRARSLSRFSDYFMQK